MKIIRSLSHVFYITLYHACNCQIFILKHAGHSVTPVTFSVVLYEVNYSHNGSWTNVCEAVKKCSR